MNLSILLLASALASSGSGGLASAPTPVRGGPSAAPAGTARAPVVSAFRATGVRDATTAATVVTCTNLGTASRTVYVDLFDYDGAEDCSASFLLPAGQCWTFATRNTALFVEDSLCAVAPLTEQGSLLVSVSGATELLCTVQLVDPAQATPRFLERLSLFTGDGTYLGFLIFEDDFESGGTGDWSAVVG